MREFKLFRKIGLQARFPFSNAFTLVELVVVITVLAILATIGFLALSGYSQDAKDSAIKANVRSVQTAISSEAALTNNSPRFYVVHDAWAALSGAFAYVDWVQTALTGGAWDQAGTNYSAWNPDYAKLRLNPEKFRVSASGLAGALAWTAGFGGEAEAAYDPKYLAVGAMDARPSATNGGKGRSVSYFQVAGIVPATGAAVVSGNYPASSGSVAGLVRDPGSPSSTWALTDGAVSGKSNQTVSCSGLPENAAYYSWTTNYSVSNGASTTAAYAETPTANTCQFNCKANYSWSWTGCVVSSSECQTAPLMHTQTASCGTYYNTVSVWNSKPIGWAICQDETSRGWTIVRYKKTSNTPLADWTPASSYMEVSYLNASGIWVNMTSSVTTVETEYGQFYTNKNFGYSHMGHPCCHMSIIGTSGTEVTNESCTLGGNKFRWW